MKSILLFLFGCIITTICNADTLPNSFGLHILMSDNEYRLSVQQHPNLEMMTIAPHHGLVTDLKYATTDNFMKKRLYPQIKSTYLRKPAATALAAVQTELKKINVGIKIWDAYRPYQTTLDMWAPIQDEKYVANPAKGSGHNKGIAIDLTLIDLSTGQELDMGTGFDDFTEKASHDYQQLSQQILHNRKLLRQVMEKYGFKSLSSEWWHYYLPGNQYELMNFSFEQLNRLCSGQVPINH